MAKKSSKTGSTKKKKELKPAGNKIFHVGIYDEQHRKNLQQRAKKVQQLYKQAVDKITKAAQPTLFGADPNLSEFHFSDFPTLNKAVDKYIQQMGAGLQSNIEQGDTEAWTLSNTKNDAMVDYLAGTYNIPKETLKEWKHPHLEALESFMERKTKGMNLSNGGSETSKLVGVWNLDQFKNELELALELGIGKGKSAAEMSKDMRQYLKYPNKLFRRVRDKSGALRLSKAAAAFHPGRGVYRSSYRNALRLTATENNIAYRTCDHKRWQALDFVLGQEIRLSNNHTLNGKPFTDICDELAGKYPKEFKFTGWHPWCRCYSVSILADEAEVDEYCKLIAEGKSVANFKFTGALTPDDMPKEFKEWVKANEDRIAGAKQMPYFLKDNPALLEKAGYTIPKEQHDLFDWSTKKEMEQAIEKKATEAAAAAKAEKAAKAVETIKSQRDIILEKAAERHAARTQEMIDDIQRRWRNDRSDVRIFKRAERTLAVAERYPSYSIKTLKEAVEKRDAIKAAKVMHKERMLLKDIVSVEREAIETGIKAKAKETNPERKKLIDSIVDGIAGTLRMNNRKALGNAREKLQGFKDAVAGIENGFYTRLTKGESASQLATRLGADCPATLKNLDKVIKAKLKNLGDDFSEQEVQDFKIAMKKLVRENDFATNTDSQYLNDILSSHYKNQFETGTSDGLFSKKVRKGISHDDFGTPLRGVKAEEYEKYGSLISKDKSDLGADYGNTVIRWKKDKVNATFTIGDSLDFEGEVSPSLVTDPQIISVGETGHNELTLGADAGRIAKFKNAAGNIKDARDVFNVGYIELQYHGQLTADCIESVTFYDNEAARKGLGAIFKLRGKNVKTYIIDDVKKKKSHMITDAEIKHLYYEQYGQRLNDETFKKLCKK